MGYLKRIIKFGLAMCGTIYYRTVSAPFVWTYIVNGKARRLWQNTPAELSEKEKAIVRSLRETGIAVAPASDIIPETMLGELTRRAFLRWQDPGVQKRAQERLKMAESSEKPAGVRKFFLVNLWDGAADPASGMPVLDITHPFLRFSLSAPVLRIVNAYLEMFAKFRLWHLEMTIPSAGKLRAIASQQWHRDPEDQKLVKVFLYLNDVDETAGPFTYLKYSHLGGKWRNVFPQHPPRGTLKMPPDADQYVPKEDILVATGRAGTVIFCDTSGLHKGGYARTNPRMMYTSAYTTRGSFWPIRYAYPKELATETLSPAARFAIANNPRQKKPKYFL